MNSKDLLMALMRIWETGNTETLNDLFNPDAVYDDIPNQHTFNGVSEIKSYITHVHSWAANVEFEYTRTHEHEDGAAVEWTMTAIQNRPIKGRIPVATGKKFLLKGLTLIEVDGDKIARAVDYIDVLSFVTQLGCTLELPEGAAKSD